MKKVVLMSNFLQKLRHDTTEADVIAGHRRQRTPRVAEIPREFLLQDLREKREFRRLARKLSAFLAFLVVYMSVLMMDRDIASCSVLRRGIARELLESSRAPSGIKFGDIADPDNYWDWLANSFFMSVYSTTDMKGQPRSDDELYSIASQSKIMGGFHLLQKRYTVVDTSAMTFADSPCFSDFLPTKDQPCVSQEIEPTSPFGTTNGSAASKADLQTLDMFRYTTNNDSVGGYQTVFLCSVTNASMAFAKLSKMHTYRWIDHQTKSVEITMSLYNFDLQLCSVVNLKAAFNLAGGVTTSADIYVINMEPYNMRIQTNVFRVVYEAVYVALLLYFVALELWNLCVVSGGNIRKYVFYYGGLETAAEWVILMSNLGILYTRYAMATDPKRNEFFKLTSLSEYFSILPMARGDTVFVMMNIVNMLLLAGRAIKYFQVTDGGRRLTNSVFSAMPDVISFLPIYITVLIGYTCAGYLLYGLSFHEWSTFTDAFFRVFEMNFGLYDPGPIYEASGVFGLLYICSASVVFCIIMLNVFMAIVMSTWEHLTEKEREKSKERRQFRDKMSFGEITGLIFIKEATLNILINVVLKLEGYDTISKHLFEKTWKAQQKNVPKLMRDHILNWYWFPGDTLDHTEVRSAPACAKAEDVQHETTEASALSCSPESGPTEDLIGKPNNVIQIPNWGKKHSATRALPTESTNGVVNDSRHTL